MTNAIASAPRSGSAERGRPVVHVGCAVRRPFNLKPAGRSPWRGAAKLASANGELPGVARSATTGSELLRVKNSYLSGLSVRWIILKHEVGSGPARSLETLFVTF